MPSWDAIFNSVQTVNAIEAQKRQYFDQLTQHTGRNCVVYYSAWQQNASANGLYSIDDDDRNGFMNALYGIEKEKGLDLILHTPGGDLAATQSIVDYLYTFFNGDLLLEEVRELYDQLDISSSEESLDKLIQNYWESVERLNQDIAISSSLFMNR